MAANRYNNTSLGINNPTTALGGTITNGDSLYFSWGSDVYTDSTGLDMSAYDFALVSLGVEFQGSFGGPGTLWKFAATAGTVMASWNGKYAYHSGNLAKLVMNPRRSDALWVNAVGTDTEVHVAKGVYQVLSGAGVTNCYQRGGDVQILKGANATTLLDQTGGRADVAADATTLINRKGAELAVTDETCTPGTIDVAGECEYAGGNAGSFYFRPGGRTDFSKLKKNITITDAYRFEGHEIIPPPAGVTITVTNDHPYPTATLAPDVAT